LNRALLPAAIALTTVDAPEDNITSGKYSGDRRLAGNRINSNITPSVRDSHQEQGKVRRLAMARITMSASSIFVLFYQDTGQTFCFIKETYTSTSSMLLCEGIPYTFNGPQASS
jgi:hypothetical protein